MMSSHILVSDPSNLSTRFSNKDRLGYDGDSEFGDADYDISDLIEHSLARADEEDLVHTEKVAFGILSPYLHRIPPREADLIRLYYQNEMKQEQIAKLFRITQAAVSYRLQRGKRRIQFLRTIPTLELDQFELELGPKFSDQDREILWRMYETTCQSEIAKQMRLTQGRVRHRFFRALQRIRELITDEVKEKKAEIQARIKKLAESYIRQNTKKVANGTSVYLGPSSEELVNGYMVSPSAQSELDEKAKSSKYAKYWTVFYAISDKHFNILHEVSLPQFRNRSDAEILPCD